MLLEQLRNNPDAVFDYSRSRLAHFLQVREFLQQRLDEGPKLQEDRLVRTGKLRLLAWIGGLPDKRLQCLDEFANQVDVVAQTLQDVVVDLVFAESASVLLLLVLNPVDLLIERLNKPSDYSLHEFGALRLSLAIRLHLELTNSANQNSQSIHNIIMALVSFPILWFTCLIHKDSIYDLSSVLVEYLFRILTDLMEAFGGLFCRMLILKAFCNEL